MSKMQKSSKAIENIVMNIPLCKKYQIEEL